MIDPKTGLEVDQIEGVPLPRERSNLIGHEQAELEFLNAYRGGRLHHAWIVTGESGIGKATLAFRIARFLQWRPDPGHPDVQAAMSLAVPEDDPVTGKVATGAHPNTLHLRRPFDDRAKRFKTELTVDEVRRTTGFFGSTAGEGGWRVCIVDSIDEANRNAANALLKILEEPPDRAIFLLVCSRPGRLLPTIQSRCRRLPVAALSDEDMSSCLAELFPDDPAESAERKKIIDYCGGSVRRACTLILGDALKTITGFEKIIAGLPSPQTGLVHALGDAVSGRAGQDNFQLVIDLVGHWLSRQLPGRGQTVPVRSNSDLATVAEVWEKVHRSAQDAEIFNLDRKAVVISIFRDLASIPVHR